MKDVTKILAAMQGNASDVSDQLLPLVYAELRRLASSKLANERPDNTLQATALVHEAYLRLVDVKEAQHWNSRGHFFMAAAEAMRRILIERARHRATQKRGSGFTRIDLDDLDVVATPADELIFVNDLLTQFAEVDEEAATLVKLRFFAGMTFTEAGKAMGISTTSAHRLWSYARAWLKKTMLALQ